jgi:hypothetical protein
MNSAFEVAASIRKWAVKRNLLGALPSSLEKKLEVDIEAVAMSDEIENLLRTKGIFSISYNNKEKSIFVYTQKHLTKKDTRILINELDDYTIYYAQGNIGILGTPPHQAQGSPSEIIKLPSGTTHYCCGSSISPGNSSTAGTLGALVHDKKGNLFGLTNNHVTGSCSHSLYGLPIVAPGIIDVSPTNLHPFTIGTHVTALEMVPGVQGNVDILKNTDAALFLIKNHSSVIDIIRNNKFHTNDYSLFN